LEYYNAYEYIKEIIKKQSRVNKRNWYTFKPMNWEVWYFD
jgi:hypothetical protein